MLSGREEYDMELDLRRNGGGSGQQPYPSQRLVTCNIREISRKTKVDTLEVGDDKEGC